MTSQLRLRPPSAHARLAAAALALGTVALGPTTVGAATPKSLSCLPEAELAWRDALALLPVEDLKGRGQTVTTVELETGEFREHLVGGRAGITDFGTYVMIEQYGAAAGDWVGLNERTGAVLRIALGDEPYRFVRTATDGSVMAGTCSRPAP